MNRARPVTGLNHPVFILLDAYVSLKSARPFGVFKLGEYTKALWIAIERAEIFVAAVFELNG
jgi:hypothetical protein